MRAYRAASPVGTQRRLAIALGLSEPGFSHRLKGNRGMRFTIEQIGALAAYVNAPEGWPFLSWEDAERVSAVKVLVADAVRRNQ